VAKKELDEINHRWGRRAWATGKIAASAARLAARKVVNATGETDGILGATMTRELDQMKGMAMKVGQILSYFDGVLPEDAQRAFQKLQRGSEPVALGIMMEALEAGLGQSPDSLFESMDPTPVASASIGQVYRAQYEGRSVAVKIQYPKIRETMEADFKHIGRISRLASLATAVDGLAITEDLRDRIVAECDYSLEAKNQRAFCTAFKDDPFVRIPGVVAERSAPRVLTTEWCEGQDFYTFVEQSSPAQRQQAARTLMRFAYRSLFEFGRLNADPHPGNYLFPDGEEVVFLDFGCVRAFEARFVETERSLMRVILDNDRPGFRQAVLDTEMVPKPRKFDFDQHWEMMRYVYEPYYSTDFTFTVEYLKRGQVYMGPGNSNLRKIAIPPPWIWVQRLQWGLHAVLTKLGAKGSFQESMREIIDTPFSPLLVDE
jgi:predicted unusual protein kinase regulating ubiquinone biosynthesis (AarF/ABC1/UbiB family)